tara:strand:- start:3657 stop:4049 length:393 start_codon:yes stop_codon:yes gene_type:complete
MVDTPGYINGLIAQFHEATLAASHYLWETQYNDESTGRKSYKVASRILGNSSLFLIPMQRKKYIQSRRRYSIGEWISPQKFTARELIEYIIRATKQGKLPANGMSLEETLETLVSEIESIPQEQPHLRVI